MKKFLTLSVALLPLAAAHALPLLAENSKQRVTEALTLYPDDRDPTMFYFFPNSSTFAREQSSGLPAFGLTYWGLTNGAPIKDAGAYLTFTLRLTSDPQQKAALQDFLNRNPRAGIAVLPVLSSTVGIDTKDNSKAPLGRLFEEFNFSHSGGRAEDEAGVNAVMTGIGAKVFRAAIDNPQLLKMDYCYKVQGLGPDFDAQIDIDWERIYTHFEAHASGGFLWTRVSINTTIERLRQDNHIRIKINGGDAKDEEYVKTIVDKVIDRLFKAELSMTPGSTASSGGFSFSSYSFNYTDRREMKHERWDLIRRKLVTQEYCVPMRISDVAQHKDKLVQDADKP